MRSPNRKCSATLITGLMLLSLLDVTRAQANGLANISNVELGHALNVEQQGQPLHAISLIMRADDKHRFGDDTFQARLHLAKQLGEHGLYQQAAALNKELAGTAKTKQDRNLALLQQAKLRHELKQHRAAHQLLIKIQGKLPKAYRADHDMIEALALLDSNEIDKAVSALPSLNTGSVWALYQRYNFGVRLLTNEQHKKHGAIILHGLGNLDKANSSELLAIKDQANLALGYSLLRINKAIAARKYLEKVRLKGPMSHMALLGMGWSYSIETNYEQALVFWQELQNRPLANTYTYESFLAVPFALSQAKAYKQSLKRYQSSKEYFDTEALAIDKARQAINDGQLTTLISRQAQSETGWARQWQPDNALFVSLLMENRHFQTLLHEYRSLLRLKIFASSIKDEINMLASQPNVKKTSADIGRLRMRQDELAKSLQQAITKQQTLLTSKALGQLDYYKTQIQNYSRQAQYGIAQVIEEAAFGIMLE